MPPDPQYTRQTTFPLILCLLSLSISSLAASGLDRHGNWTKKFAKGPKAQLAAGTFFGAAGHEEMLGVASLPDGSIMAFGNSWGPPFPDVPKPKVLGLDAYWEVPLHQPGMEFDKKGRKRPPSAQNPNRTGFLAFYSSDLKQLKKVVRFGWGVASITAGRQFKDKSFVIAGQCTPSFRALAKKTAALKLVPRDMKNKRMGPYQYADTALPGDVYVARLKPDLSDFEWICIFEAHRRAPGKLFEGKDGMVVFDIRGVKGITADGKTVQPFKTRRMGGGSYQHKFLDVNPKDGAILFGGDSQSGTGQEPWRKPILVAFDMEGNLKWRLYDFDGPVVGHHRYRLVSDTSARVASFSEDGELAVSLWSDGGNTIATRNPIDLDRPVDGKGIGMSLWGANVLSACHLVRFNPETCEKVWYSVWSAYLKEKPNSVTIKGMKSLKTGETAVFGGSASWLVQTPNAFYSAPDKPGGGRGGYVAIFNKTFSNALFSSAVAKCTVTGVTEGEKGVVFVSQATAAADDDGNKAPVANAVQAKFGGGLLDGHIFLMSLPGQGGQR